MEAAGRGRSWRGEQKQNLMLMLMLVGTVKVEGIVRAEHMTREAFVSTDYDHKEAAPSSLSRNVPSLLRPTCEGIHTFHHHAAGLSHVKYTLLAPCRGGEGAGESLHLRHRIEMEEKARRKGTNPLVVLQRTLSGRPEYEFTLKDEETFLNTTKLMRHVVRGLLVHSSVQAVMVLNNIREHGIAAIPQFGDCIDELWYAYFINAASSSYEAIVHTQGADIHNLMQAVQKELQLWKKYRVPLVIKTVLMLLMLAWKVVRLLGGDLFLQGVFHRIIGKQAQRPRRLD
eukprot:766066-Hanusia_phi.AAC.1